MACSPNGYSLTCRPSSPAHTDYNLPNSPNCNSQRHSHRVSYHTPQYLTNIRGYYDCRGVIRYLAGYSYVCSDPRGPRGGIKWGSSSDKNQAKKGGMYLSKLQRWGQRKKVSTYPFLSKSINPYSYSMFHKIFTPLQHPG